MLSAKFVRGATLKVYRGDGARSAGADVTVKRDWYHGIPDERACRARVGTLVQGRLKPPPSVRRLQVVRSATSRRDCDKY